MKSDLEQLRAHLDAPPRDARGRLASAGRRDDVPCFVFARTREGNLWRFRDDLDPGLVRGLARLSGRERPLAQAVEDAPPPERLENLRRLFVTAGVEVGVEHLEIRRSPEGSGDSESGREPAYADAYVFRTCSD